MITCAFRNDSSILPLQVQDILFRQWSFTSNLWTTSMTRQFTSVGHSGVFFRNCILVSFFFLQLYFGLSFSAIAFYVHWWILTYCSCNCNWLLLYCGWKICEAWILGKCFVTNWRNVYATLLETDLLRGRLNHIMFCFHIFCFSDLLLVYFRSTL